MNRREHEHRHYYLTPYKCTHRLPLALRPCHNAYYRIRNYCSAQCFDNFYITVKDSAFIGNKALHGEGGGILAFDSDTNKINIADSIFYGNRANQGGGIAVVGSPVSVHQSLFMHNGADELGGAFFIRCGDTSVLKVSGSLFSQNKSGYDGGGIFNQDNGIVEIVRSLVSGNTPNNCTGCP